MVPEDIVSDRGPQFMSRVWKAFMERLGVSSSLTSGFQSESNGQVERVIQHVGRFLRSYCQDRPGEWAAFVPWAEMSQNYSSNLSPFQCVLGYQPVPAPWHQSQIEAPAVDDWFRRVLSRLSPMSVPLLVRAEFGGRRHWLPSHCRSTFHFQFVLSLYSTHLLSITQFHVHYLTLCFPHVGVCVCLLCSGCIFMDGIVWRVRFYGRYLRVTGIYTHL